MWPVAPSTVKASAPSPMPAVDCVSDQCVFFQSGGTVSVEAALLYVPLHDRVAAGPFGTDDALSVMGAELEAVATDADAGGGVASPDGLPQATAARTRRPAKRLIASPRPRRDARRCARRPRHRFPRGHREQPGCLRREAPPARPRDARGSPRRLVSG